VNTTAVNLPYFDGFIDEFALYNTALTSSRAAAHYQVANTFVAPLEITSFRLEGGVPVIRWSGNARLQFASDAGGPFVDVPGASSPYVVTPNGPAGFFRLAK
jgi:hypothetical protein